MDRGRAARAMALAVLMLCGPAACDRAREISHTDAGAYEVSVARRPDGSFVAAWHDTRDGNAEIYGQFLDTRGRPLGVVHRLTQSSEQSYEASVEGLADGVAVAWYDKTPDGHLHARLAFFDREWRLVWSRTLGGAGGATRNPVVAAHGDALFVAWVERTSPSEERVRGEWISSAGQPSGAIYDLGGASATTWNLNATVDAVGVAFVAYDAHVESLADELMLARVATAGVTINRLTADDGASSKYPDLDFSVDGSLALTWFDERDGNQEVYLWIGTLDTLLADGLTRANRITDTPGHSIGAYLAWNGERLGLAWSDDTTGAHEIYLAVFDRVTSETPSVHRLTRNSTSSLIPAIVPGGAGFALAWNEAVLGGNGVHDPDTPSQVMFLIVE